MQNIVPKVSVGVDVSKDHLDICLLPMGTEMHVENSISGLTGLLEELAKHDVNYVVCEPSGGYEQLLRTTLETAGYNVWLVDAIRIHAFIRSEGIRVKTDKYDAKMIALFASQKVRKHQSRSITPAAQKLRAFVKRKLELTKMAAAEKTRLKQPLKSHIKQSLERSLQFLSEEMKVIEAEIAAMIEQDDDWSKRVEIVESVPGIGKSSAIALVTEVPELGDLENKQAASLIGVAPITRRSGKYVGVSSIQGGRPHPRQVLYMCALSASRCNPLLKAFYDRLIATGKKAKVALIAVMRKLVTMINTMLKNNESWRVAS